MSHSSNQSRRDFIAMSGSFLAGSFFIHPVAQALDLVGSKDGKMKLALVGTGIRGTTMFGRDVLRSYGELVEFVGLSDINPGRLAYAKKFIGANCPVFTDFDQMLKEAKPDVLIVTTMDSTHHEFIIKGLNAGIHVISEKPMTTDEFKCQDILDAERKSGKK